MNMCTTSMYLECKTLMDQNSKGNLNHCLGRVVCLVMEFAWCPWWCNYSSILLHDNLHVIDQYERCMKDVCMIDQSAELSQQHSWQCTCWQHICAEHSRFGFKSHSRK